MHTAKQREIKIVEKPCHQLTDGERRRFMAIHRKYYSTTAAGFDAIHQENYRRMMENQPTSLAYFVEINGKCVAAALVLKKKRKTQQKALEDRWYSMPVDEEKMMGLEKNREERLKLTTNCLDKLAKRIIETTPNAWGTVEASHIGRVNFFRRRHWQVAADKGQLLERVKYVHPEEKFSFATSENGWLVFQRRTSIHLRKKITRADGKAIVRKKAPVPEYWQVLMVPKHRAASKPTAEN